MSEVNLQLVREFFELHLFHVLTHWEQSPADLQPSRPRPSESAPLLFATCAAPGGPPPPFLLQPADTAGLRHAVVEVRAWHADRFYPSVIEANPVLAHVASAEVRALAGTLFDTGEFSTLLVISELPASPEPRARSLELLRASGVDHVLEFPTVLRGILDRVHAHGHYGPSASLQTLRLMKRYGLVRRQQLEFAFPAEPQPPRVPPVVHADPPVEDASED